MQATVRCRFHLHLDRPLSSLLSHPRPHRLTSGFCWPVRQFSLDFSGLNAVVTFGNNMASTEALAAQHLAIAIQLMGRDWVIAHVPATDAPAASNRGRKAGVLPDADRRCVFRKEDGSQCKNSRSGDTQVCKLHINAVILLNQ